MNCPTCRRDRKPEEASCWWCGAKFSDLANGVWTVSTVDAADVFAQFGVPPEMKKWAAERIAASIAKVDSARVDPERIERPRALNGSFLPTTRPELPANASIEIVQEICWERRHKLEREGFNCVSYCPLNRLYTMAKVT